MVSSHPEIATTSKSLNLPIILTGSDDIPLARIANNIFLNKMLINSDSVTFKSNDIVQISFELNFDGISKHSLIWGKYRGVLENSIVIEFCRYNSEIFGVIKKLMFNIDLRELSREKYTAISINGNHQADAIFLT